MTKRAWMLGLRVAALLFAAVPDFVVMAAHSIRF